jgi:hypothetical protein
VSFKEEANERAFRPSPHACRLTTFQIWCAILALRRILLSFSHVTMQNSKVSAFAKFIKSVMGAVGFVRIVVMYLIRFAWF